MSRAAIDLTGQVFDQLTVIERVFTKKGSDAQWECVCQCGGFTVTTGYALRSGHTKSCGHRRRAVTRENQKCRIIKLVAKKTDTEIALHWALGECKRGASKRGLSFELSKAMFSELVLGVCHYCGTPPISGRAAQARSRGRVLLNGVDRVDSKLGYVDSNVVSCCKHCNKAKLDRSVEDFVSHCRQVVAHHDRQKVA